MKIFYQKVKLWFCWSTKVYIIFKYSKYFSSIISGSWNCCIWFVWFGLSITTFKIPQSLNWKVPLTFFFVWYFFIDTRMNINICWQFVINIPVWLYKSISMSHKFTLSLATYTCAFQRDFIQNTFLKWHLSWCNVKVLWFFLVKALLCKISVFFFLMLLTFLFIQIKMCDVTSIKD